MCGFQWCSIHLCTVSKNAQSIQLMHTLYSNGAELKFELQTHIPQTYLALIPLSCSLYSNDADTITQALY